MKSKSNIQSAASAEAVRQFRRSRYNPLRHISPQMLARALDSFEMGDFREFYFLAETVAERDEVIKCVKAKREKSVSQRPWSILLKKDSAEAHEHREALDDFWNKASAVDAYDRNVRGGIGRLIKQMMSAASFGYASHHLVWKVTGRKLSATFEFVPLCFFKNKTGRFRFVLSEGDNEGSEMQENEWLVTAGDGLMKAGLVAYVAKRFSLQDWLAFSEKFSMPGILGATSAAMGSPEGLAMKAAVESFSQDWSAVMYGVQDPTKSPIHLVQPDGTPAAMPMPALVERVDRRLATLWCGADLSTMSSSEGQGTGASLQSAELNGLITDDCMMISETLQEVDRQVIRWHFGEEVEPLAYFKLMPPTEYDKREQLTIMKALTDAGVRIEQNDAVSRLGLRVANANEAALADLKPR